MRGAVAGLASAAPLSLRLPGTYQEEEFAQRFVGAFDEGLAPIIATLDGLPGYVDPWLAPSDFLDWLAGWVGIEVDEAWTLSQRRAIVAGASLVHRRRGTTQGIADAVRLTVADCEVEVLDSGGTTWSATAGGALPGASPPVVTVRIRTEDPGSVDVRRVDALIEAIKPAHVEHVVTLVTGEAKEA